MIEDMKPSRIINSILQDTNYKGYYLLVEGIKDIRLYKKFFCQKQIKIKACFGKYNQREILNELNKQSFFNKLAIRDSDFIRLRNKYNSNSQYKQYLFLTDYHDSEIMFINSKALDNFLHTVTTEDKISEFEKKHGKVIDYLYSSLYDLGCLKLANRLFDLNLIFKPSKQDGPKIKFKKFIDEKNFNYIGEGHLIDTVIEYSRNNSSTRSFDKQKILNSLKSIRSNNFCRYQLVNGHDICELLFLILTKSIKSTSSILVDANCIEDSLCMSYESKFFENTNLYKQISNWEIYNIVNILEK